MSLSIRGSGTMYAKFKKIINSLYLGIKVGYLFVSGQVVSKKDISASYDFVSETYQQQYLATMHIYNEQLLDHLKENIKHGKSLDLAGGTGFNCTYINESGNYHLDLVDLSKEMLKQYRSNDVTKINSGMLDYLKHQNCRSYDAIICTWALMYECPQKVIKECYRVLKNHGYLYILVNDKQTLPQIRKVYLKLLVEHVSIVKKLMFDLPTPKNQSQLNNWAKQAGFKQNQLETLKQDFNFDNWQEAAKFAVSSGALAGYDVMIDLHDHMVFKTLVKELNNLKGRPCITHHFIKGIFYKGDD